MNINSSDLTGKNSNTLNAEYLKNDSGRLRELKVPRSVDKPEPVRKQIAGPTSSEVWARAFAGLAAIADKTKTFQQNIKAMKDSNNLATENKYYAGITTSIDIDFAELATLDYSKLPDALDAINAKYRDQINNEDFNAEVKDNLIIRYYKETTSRARTLALSGVLKKQEFNIKAMTEDIAKAINENNMENVTEILDRNVLAGTISIDEGARLGLAAKDEMNYNTVLRKLSSQEIHESLSMLNDIQVERPAFMEDITETNITQLPPEKIEELLEYKKNIEFAKSVNRLTPEQKKDMRTSLINKDSEIRTANSYQYGNSFDKLLSDMKNGLQYEDFKKNMDQYPGFSNARDEWNKVKGIFAAEVTAEQEIAYNKMLGLIIDDQDLQGNVQHSAELRYTLSQTKNDYGSHYKELAGMLDIPEGSIVDPGEVLSEKLIEQFETLLITGKINPAEFNVLASNGVKSGDVKVTDWKSSRSILKNYETENVQSLLADLDTTRILSRFKDKNGIVDQEKYTDAVTAIRQMVKEAVTGNMPMGADQIQERYRSIINIITEEKIKKDIEKGYNENPLGWYKGNMDRTVKRMLSGDLSSLRYVDPGMYEELSTEMNANAKIIAADQFPEAEFSEKVRLHEDFLPVYKVDNKEYVIGLSENERKQVLLPLDEALETYKNLAYGKPIGSILEDMILTFDGYKRKEDLQIVNINGSEGYQVLNSDGTVDENKPSYVLARNNRGEQVFSPIYSNLTDVAGVTKELRNITEIPMTKEQIDNMEMMQRSEKKAMEMIKQMRPYNGGN